MEQHAQSTNYPTTPVRFVPGGLTSLQYGSGFGQPAELGIVNQVVEKWVPALEAAAALGQGALGAELDCGCGQGTIALAEAFPNSHFFGFDQDYTLLRRAQRRAAAYCVAERTTFEAATPESFPNHRYAMTVLRSGLWRLRDPLRAARRALLTLDALGSLLVVEPAPFTDEQLRSSGPIHSILVQAGFKRVRVLDRTVSASVFEARS